jgi:hypothetical protein
VYAQVVLADEKELAVCDAILTSRAALSDLLMKDLDFVETRLGRDAGEAEKKVLQKMAEGLVSETPVCKLGLTAEDLAAISAHAFVTNRPVVVAGEADLAAPDALLVRALAESGYISFLTVGGKENRAWPIRAGTTAWEAAGTSTPTCRRGSFARRLSASPILWRRAGRRRPSAPAKSGWN